MSQCGNNFFPGCRKMLCLPICAIVASLVLAEAGRGQTMLQQEPGTGMLRPDETALVDDHSCPKGQVKEVTGGSNRRYIKDIEIPGTPRQRRCVPRP
jgi:hypothetical protein